MVSFLNEPWQTQSGSETFITNTKHEFGDIRIWYKSLQRLQTIR